MKLPSRRVLAVLATAALAAVILPASSVANGPSPTNKIFARQLAIELGQAQAHKWEMPLSGGTMTTLLGVTGGLATPQSDNGHGGPNAPNCASNFAGGGNGAAKNVRVNQDCSLRRQAEEVVAVNPTNESNLIAGQNDSIIGYNHCGYDYSFDGGKTWGTVTPPFWSHVQGDNHTADACSDPTATFDSQGNAYVGGVLFDLASNAGSIVVQKSNAPIGGAFYHTPTTGPYQLYSTDPIGLVAATNSPSQALDKEFIVADSHADSPKADNVYATYTLFELTGAGVGIHSPIYFSQSTDGGATWSAGIEISGSNAAWCTGFSGEADPNACDQDQGSDPIVGADGTVYVSFMNGNLPGAGIGQHMIVKCGPADDCTDPANWSAPVRMGDIDYGTQPIGPDPSTGCPAGRQCLPPNGYRMTDATEGSISVDNNGTLYSVWADFRNGGGTCATLSSAATATSPCDNDVFYNYSTDGGTTWSDTVQLTPAGSAQWQPWSAVTADGSKLYVAYYDRSYGNCEETGCNDITLATITNAASDSPTVSHTRITTSSMPNLTPDNNPVQAGFLGDYMWVTTDSHDRALMTWADTRGQGGTVEEDIYFSRTSH